MNEEGIVKLALDPNWILQSLLNCRHLYTFNFEVAVVISL